MRRMRKRGKEGRRVVEGHGDRQIRMEGREGGPA